MKKTTIYLLMLAAITLATSCSKDIPEPFRNTQKADKTVFNKEITFTGTVKYIALEGGFYGIISDDGKHYDPVDLPAKYQKDGLRVKVKALILDNQASFHMWGIMISVISVETFLQNFETIEIGTYSGITTPQNLVVNDDRKFKALWDAMHSIMTPLPDYPKVDFKKETVIGIFMGEFMSGGYSVEVLEVKEKNKDLIVYFTTNYPKPGQAVTMALTQPYHLIRVKGIHKNVKFEFVSGIKNADIRQPDKKIIKDTN